MLDAASRPMPLKTRIREYVTGNFYVDGAGLADEDSLLERGVIDSTGVMEIIQYVEREFAVHVDDGEIVPENLDSIGRIARFVERKRQSVAAAG